MSDEAADQKMQMVVALRDRRRFEEAEALLKEALAQDPELADAHYQLALTYLCMDKRKRDALAAVDKAVEHDAEDPWYHALRAGILADLREFDKAHHSADYAIQLDAELPAAHRAKAEVYCDQDRWAEAEDSLLEALKLDADDEGATNMLAHVQRMQDKMDETGETIDQLLSENPESAYAHHNAGWAALQRNDHKQAEMHFREALRLDASFDGARDGLLESFKARSLPYRLYLSYCFFMQRFTEKARWLLIIGLLVGVRVGRSLLEKVSPLAASLLIFTYLLFVLWVWLASGVGNFLVLMDSSAKHALRRGEKWEGIAVGGGLLLGLVVFFGSTAANLHGLAAAGALIGLSTIPASLTFTNESRAGRFLFGGMTAFAYLGAFIALFHVIASGPAQKVDLISGWIGFAILTAVACTWLGNAGSLREHRE